MIEKHFVQQLVKGMPEEISKKTSILRRLGIFLEKRFSVPLFLGFLTLFGTLLRLNIINERSWLDESLARKNTIYNEVADALSDLRGTRTLIRERCKYYPEEENDRNFIYTSNERRINATIALLKAGEKVVSEFGSRVGQETGKKIHAFNSWDGAMANVCKQDDSISEQYYQKTVEILEPMRKVIEQQKQHLRHGL